MGGGAGGNPGADSSPKLEAVGIEKSFGRRGETLRVLDGISLSVAEREFVAVVGPSGCGKSTLLDILAGLQTPDRGRVVLDGREMTGQVGGVGYMPQKDLLLPWRSVLDNTILGLEIVGVRKAEARDEALRWFPTFGLVGFERSYPSALSGGMRQRAALLRTFLTRRDVLLLDEPFGALDAMTRAEMQSWLLDVWSEARRTVVLVTHDVDEALYLADRVSILSARPARILASLEVPIPRPRSYASVVTSQPFTNIKVQLLDLLRGAGR